MSNEWDRRESRPEDPGATRLAVPRVPDLSRFAASTQAPGPGATMVAVPRVGAPAPFVPPDDARGATMVAVPRLGASAPFVPPEDAPGATMVGLSRAPAAAAPRPSGPPAAYEIVRHLGGGELGQVFHARHRGSGQEVALRLVRPDIARTPGAAEALREVVALARNAVHAHLGRQLEFDESASAALVVEYVPGRTLSSILAERGAAPAAAVVDLGLRLCSALVAAHAAGLAHGRLHAGNVVLEAKTGRWVMLDLGHAYALQGLEPAHDLYALGALLYELATGRAPFEDGADAPDPRTYQPALPASLAAVLNRTLAADPAAWFGSAVELAQALARARNQKG